MIDDDADDEPTLADEALDLVRRARLAGASDLAVRVLQRFGITDFAVALCREAESEDDVYRWLTAYMLGGHEALAKAAQGKMP